MRLGTDDQIEGKLTASPYWKDRVEQHDAQRGFPKRARSSNDGERKGDATTEQNLAMRQTW